MSVTPSEIAALRLGYLWRTTSIAFVSVALNVIFAAATGTWSRLWLAAAGGLLLLLGVNWLIAQRLFEPIRRYLAGQVAFEDIQRRLTQLPLLSARYVGLLALAVVAFQNSMAWWFPSDQPGLSPPTIVDFVTICIVLSFFFFTYTYFVVSDYLAKLCDFIFARFGRNLGLFFGSYRLKLIVALLVVSAAPLAAIVAHLFSYDGERLQVSILVDVASAIFGIAISAYFISRSLLRPIGVLSRAMTKVVDGDFAVRVPVTSNDEVGQLTGRFNDMIEGLREREQIRETFGRYVDENVAAAILRRQGDGQRSGEIGEATILFTDIENFTTIAEYLAPHELVGVLNDYLETVLSPIRDHGGVVNTFIGDGLFASFNMPLACEDHAAAAVRAAIDIQRAVGSRTFGTGVALATRIGISTGPVIGGDIGTGRRMSFTLLGETVNLASRLEGLNKEHGTKILVSDSTCAACGDRFVFRPLGKVVVRGLGESVAVYSVDAQEQHGQPVST